MVSWKKLMCVAFVCFYLGFMVCLANAAQQAPEPETVKTKAELKREKKARDAEKIKARREAAAKAERAAAAKAKAERVERGRGKEELLIQKLKLPRDTTPQLAVKELRISGNVLVSTDELLENMPLVYNASDKPLEKADKGDLYDFRVLRDIILQPGRSRQVSTRTIQGFTQYILSVYQEQDYAGIYVYVPAGAVRAGVELRDGILPVEVLEAPVTGVTISAYDPDQKKMEKGFLRTTAVREWSPIEVGQVANQKKLDDFVNLLNLNPDRYVSATVTKGIEPDSLAVEYNIYEANPWHFFIQVDNSGTKDRQWTPRRGIINTNLLGVDDTLTVIYQAPMIWESDWDENYSLYGSYDFPIYGPRLRLNVYGGYSEYDISAAGIGFVGNGSFIGGKLRYNVLQTKGWFLDLTTSLSHERTKVTSSLAALFPGFFASDVEYQLWGIGLDIHKRDDMSQSSLIFERVQSVGGSKEAHFKAARTNTDDNFAIYTATAAHSQFLKPYLL